MTETQSHRRWRFNHQFHGGLDRELNKKLTILDKRCVSAIGTRFAHSCAHLDLKGKTCKLIARSFVLFSINDITSNSLPLFLFNENVQCVVGDESFLSMRDQSRSSSARALQASWSTFLMALEWTHDPITSCAKFSIFFATVTAFW